MNILKCYSIIKLILIISFFVNADRLPNQSYFENEYGAFLLKKSTRVFHDHFTNAYKHASYGDIIELAGKTNDCGNIKFVFNKPGISIIGKGREESVIKANGFLWKNTAINNFISGLALTQDENDLDDLVFFHNSISSSSFINFRAENVKFDAKSKNANHCFEIAGQYIELNNVHVKSNNGHPFVLKGVSNVTMKDCSSSGKTAFNGLLIKSSSLRGNCHDIHIDDFRAEDEIYLQVANNNTFITNVVLKNININNPEGYGVIIGNQSADILNNDVRDVSIDGLTGVADKAIMCAWADDIYNLSFKNININYSSKLLDFVRINNFENITLNNKKIK